MDAEGQRGGKELRRVERGENYNWVYSVREESIFHKMGRQNKIIQ